MITTSISINKGDSDGTIYNIFCDGDYLGEIEVSVFAENKESLGSATCSFQHNRQDPFNIEDAWAVMKDYLVNTEKCKVTE